MNVWFLGDLHAGHKNIHKYRTQFESEEHHFQVVKENYFKVVRKKDKVFFLGDTAFTKERLLDVAKWPGTTKQWRMQGISIAPLRTLITPQSPLTKSVKS